MSGEPNVFSDRAERLRGMVPALTANVRLYPSEAGGKTKPAYPGWGCPCMITQDLPLTGYDGWMVLDNPLLPGEARANVPFVFLSPEGGRAMLKAGHFFLWEGGFIGEAEVSG